MFYFYYYYYFIRIQSGKVACIGPGTQWPHCCYITFISVCFSSVCIAFLT